MKGVCHSTLVVVVRARRRQGDSPERQSRRFALRFKQLAPYAVHGYAIEGLINRRQQAEYDIFLRLLTERMQGPGAVLATAPGDHNAFSCSVGSQGKIVPSNLQRCYASLQ